MKKQPIKGAALFAAVCRSIYQDEYQATKDPLRKEELSRQIADLDELLASERRIANRNGRMEYQAPENVGQSPIGTLLVPITAIGIRETPQENLMT